MFRGQNNRVEVTGALEGVTVLGAVQFVGGGVSAIGTTSTGRR